MSHHGRGRAGTEQALWHAQTRCRSGPDTQNSKFTARRSNRTVFNSASSRILLTSWLWLFLAQAFSQTPSFHPRGSRRGVCKKMNRAQVPVSEKEYVGEERKNSLSPARGTTTCSACDPFTRNRRDAGDG